MQRRRKLHKTKDGKIFNLHSIPSVVVLVFLFGLLNLFFLDSCHAYFYDCADGASCASGSVSDVGTITPIAGGTATPPTASLSLNSYSLTSNAVTPGNIATASTNVTVSVSNASSYSLTLKMDSTNLTNGSTTITAGNPGDSSKSNVWGYKWDNASTYTAPSASGNTLIPTTTVSGNVSFTKTLTFGAKFSSSANAGAYHTNGTISLVATPKETVITLADLTQMQQLSLAPEACANTPYLSGKNYSETYTLTDVRDNARYTVARLEDGKCWMTSNLGLSGYGGSLRPGLRFQSRNLIPTTSDISADWSMPSSELSAFTTTNTAIATYRNTATTQDTAYYTWCAATAGSCSSATTTGANASSSICPKGWRLPTGRVTGSNTINEFYNLFNAINNKTTIVSGTLSSSSSTNWATNGLSTVQGSPYNFAFTGSVSNGNYYAPASNQYGYWWSSTADGSTGAYSLRINSSDVYPGTLSSNRYSGYAVRCVAQ